MGNYLDFASALPPSLPYTTKRMFESVCKNLQNVFLSVFLLDLEMVSWWLPIYTAYSNVNGFLCKDIIFNIKRNNKKGWKNFTCKSFLGGLPNVR